jgi:flagellar basal-body rod protein FlgF
MDNTIYVGLSKQITLQRELDITANNLANTDTVGYKFEDLMTRALPSPPAGNTGVAGPVNFVVDAGVARDFTQGALNQTHAPLDVAIDGKGFFQIAGPDGPRYTRDGRFKLDSTGRIVTEDGDPVQGDGGDIVLDPKKGPVSISPTGVVSQAGQRVAKLALVTFDDPSVLSKVGNNQFVNDSSDTPQPATEAMVEQGMLESSNVQPIVQITHLITIQRAYEAVTNMINTAADLSKSAIQRLGSAST